MLVQFLLIQQELGLGPWLPIKSCCLRIMIKARFKSIDEKGLSYLSEGMMEGAFAIPNFHAKN